MEFEYLKTNSSTFRSVLNNYRSLSKNEFTRSIWLCKREILDELIQKASSITEFMVVINLYGNQLNSLPQDIKIIFVENLEMVFENNNGCCCDTVINNISEFQKDNQKKLYLGIMIYNFVKQPENKYVAYEYMHDDISSCMQLTGLYDTSFDQVYFLYGNPVKNELKKTEKRVAVVFSGAYGDTVVAFPILYSFCEKQIELGYKVTLLSADDKSYVILSAFQFTPDVEVKKINISSSHKSEDMLNKALVTSNIYLNVYNLIERRRNNMFLAEPQTLYSYYSDQLDIRDKINNFTQANKLRPCSPNDVKKQISELKNNYKWIVGCQFYTDNDILLANVANYRKKSWVEKNIADFYQLCRENDICLINFAPSPYKINGMVDISWLKVEETFEIMSEMDAFVGIDSCFGHIASFVGIPNITLWFGHYPTTDINSQIMMRPLRLNYSLVVRNSLKNTVTPNDLIQRLLYMLDNKNSLNDRLLTNIDVLNDLNTDYF